MRKYKELIEITQEEAFAIIADPYAADDGLFWQKDGDCYIGIDNTTHAAWTEEFSTKGACFDWLRGADLND